MGSSVKQLASGAGRGVDVDGTTQRCLDAWACVSMGPWTLLNLANNH